MIFRVASSSGLIKRNGNSDRQGGGGVRVRLYRRGQNPDQPISEDQSIPAPPILTQSTSVSTTSDEAITLNRLTAATSTITIPGASQTAVPTQPNGAPSTNTAPQELSNDKQAAKSQLDFSAGPISAQQNNVGSPLSLGAKMIELSRRDTKISIPSSPSPDLSPQGEQENDSGTSNLPLSITSAPQQTGIPSAPLSTSLNQDTADSTNGDEEVSHNSIIVISSIVGGLLLLIFIAWLLYYRRKQKRLNAGLKPLHRPYPAKNESVDEWIPHRNGTIVYNLTPSICQNKHTPQSKRLSQVSSFVAESPRFTSSLSHTDPVPS